MDELCTACLSAGRNLFSIQGSDIQQIFNQILNEISVPGEMVSQWLRVCWECRALLRRFQAFRRQAQECYTELMGVGLAHQNTTSKQHRSGLSVVAVLSISYPEKVSVKLEPELKRELDDAHCEPQTFADELAGCRATDRSRAGRRKKKRVAALSDLDPEPAVKTEGDAPLAPTDHAPCGPEAVVRSPALDNTRLVREKRTFKKKSKQKVKIKKKKAVKSKEISDAGSDLDFDAAESFAEREFPCTLCEESFVEERELERHIDSSHVVKKAIKRNGASSRSKEPLPEKPQCVECGKMFSSRKTYRYHLNVLHKGQNRYPCPRCGRVYQWKSNLGRHMRTHKARDNNELHCGLCDKRFASVATYRQHLRVSRRHVSEKDFTFMCNECGKKFVNKTRLRDHIDWDHLNKIKFRCQLCNKPFKCHTSLYVHLQNVHRNKEKKENLCHVCGKSYPNAAKLKYHIVAMHTTETPYRCAQCGAAFGWYSSLYRHVREVHYKMKLQPNKIRKQKVKLLPPPGMP